MKFNILVASNSSYLPFLKVMLHSLFEQHMQDDMDIYLPYEDMAEEELDNLKGFISGYRQKNLVTIKIGDGFKNRVEAHNGISIDTYYRILAINLLPDSVDKILYLDADMIVKGSIKELYETDIEGMPFAVCEDILGILNDFHEANKYRMSIPERYSYFNAGVMLMNIKYLKETGAAEAILDRIYSGYERYEYNDQDVLNEMYYDSLVYIPWEKYNCPPALYIKSRITGEYLSYAAIKTADETDIENLTQEVRDKAVIIHYMANTKPWSANRDESAVYDIFDPAFFEARKNAGLEPDYGWLFKLYAANNYSAEYLRCMLDAAALPQVDTFIIGSSYGLCDIDAKLLTHQVNLSMTSQDLKYDYLMFKEGLNRAGKNQIKKLILIVGEYVLYDYLEKNSQGKVLISQNYGPVLYGKDGWEFAWKYGLCTADKEKIEAALKSAILERGGFFSDIYTREDNTEDCYKGLDWSRAGEDERNKFALKRAEAHNRLYKFEDEAIKDNKDNLRNILELAEVNDIKSTIVIAPFSTEYESVINPKMQEKLLDVLNEMPYEVDYYNMNELVEKGEFSTEDFFDMDHLSVKGANKLTKLILRV